MSRVLFVLIALTYCFSARAEKILVGMFYGANHVRATMQVTSGRYDVYADGVAIFSMHASESADITSTGNEVRIFFKGQNYTASARMHFLDAESSRFKMTPAGAKPSIRLYEQNLVAIPYSGRLQLINELDVEDYVSGVIEAESGSGQELEYYKVQAVISRTYALNNLRRHAAEQFHVCDATHCQVFHGEPRIEKKARIAADQTRDVVIIDDDVNLITAAFHSNCGGHTVNAEDVWLKPVSYLVGRSDTFCLKMPHSNWEKSFPRKRWIDYLHNKRFPLSDDPTEEELAYYPQSKSRYYEDSNVRIPTRRIREDFNLRSAFFVIQDHGDSITFTGQGFGHGVGLCQEGAMRMALLGEKYEKIIHYYYKDVHLVPRHLLWFYRE